MQTNCVGLQLSEQQAPLLLHAVPGPPHGVSHHPAEFFTNPAQQSFVDDAEPSRGTHELLHVHSWLVVDAPQYGTLEQHSDAPLHVWPPALHVGGARHTPPASKLVPAQQSAALFARMPSPAQLALHTGEPVAVDARQYGTVEQHGVGLERHAVPDDRQLGAERHTPAASMLNPAQQSPCEAAFTPSGAQVLEHELADVAEVPRQNFAVVQHSLAVEQLVPAEPHVGADWQTPLVHASWLQHCVPPPQVCPLLRQLVCTWQVPLRQARPVQHGLVAEQVAPEELQVDEGWQLPELQVRPEQHGSPPAQLWPVMRQAVP